MSTLVNSSAGRVVAFLDLGTNSVRLLLVRINPNQTFTVLTQEREVVRLGETVFVDHRLRPAAMRRALVAIKDFVSLARSRGATEIVAVATSATREAKNRGEFLGRISREAGIEVRTISGKEEARLIYLGVSSGLHLGDRRTLFADVGGGSTEVAVGDGRRYYYLDSLRLGAIRLTALLIQDLSASISRRKYEALRRYVDDAAAPTFKRLKDHPIETFVGSAGTIENIAEIASQTLYQRPTPRDGSITYDELSTTIELLRSLPLKERRKVPGIDPERADIIVPGAAIVESFMDELGLEELRVSDRGTRDGLLVDYLANSEHHRVYSELSVRQRSVFQLARACGSDEDHTRIVGRLALELFDSAEKASLHRLGPRERELLEYAALLHDIGVFLSYDDQHQHAWYLISSADMLGFDQREVTIMAALAFFARRGFPKQEHAKLAGLNDATRRDVRLLCALLRIADSLDRSRRGLVLHATLEAIDRSRVRLQIEGSGDMSLDLWGLEYNRASVERMLGRRLRIEQRLRDRRPR